MKRKTSDVPTRVYKYALKPPTENDELADESFCAARWYYNQLVTIENRRRYRYRAARTEHFPELARAEARVCALETILEEQRSALSQTKAAGRTRQVNPEGRAAVLQTIEILRQVRRSLGQLTRPIAYFEHREKEQEIVAALFLLQEAGKTFAVKKTEEKLARVREQIVLEETKAKADGLAIPPDLRERVSRFYEETKTINEEAQQAVKALRPTLYWGTYLLVEAAFNQASSKSRYDVAYNDSPSHLLTSRIGVHWVGGATVDDVTKAGDTVMQIANLPVVRLAGKRKDHWRTRLQRDADGHVVHCELKFRAGSDGRKPVWVVFPLAYDRPLPEDGLIKYAYVTRRPLRVRNPWQYHLCVVVESKSFERALPHTTQEGTTAINFGWRSLEGGLRVATIVRDGRTPEHVELPARFVSGFGLCRRLQGLVDEKFDAIKEVLSAWLATHEDDLPEELVASFERLGSWKSSYRLCELVYYWQSHRVEGDADVWPSLDEWHKKHVHLSEWMTNQRSHLLRWRRDFYRKLAKDLTTSSARLVLDTFHIASVARRTPAEEVEEGGDVARRNRTIAAPGELRLEIVEAAKRHHCEVVAAPTVDGTRRCNVCGETYEWDPASELVHTCPGDGSQWDQDVNNADNLLDASASGEVVQLVRPAMKLDDGDFQPSATVSYGTARKALGK